jgi:DNA polymerase elongation subunit (family B)
MTKEEFKDFLKENSGYLKWGALKLSKKFDLTAKKVKDVKKELNRELKAIKARGFKRMFFDIETSPNIVYSWRTGYRLSIPPENIIKERAIICICYKWEFDDKVHYLTWDENQNDKFMLELFIQEVLKADEVIGHNGDKFDLPWVKTRAAIHELKFPAYVKSLDTLSKVRREGFNFNSNKLDYLSKILLGEQKMETGGFQLWVDICEKNDPKAMETMVNYCKKDVVLLEKVYHRLQNYFKPNTHVGAKISYSKECCPGCGEDTANHIKVMTTAAGTIQHLVQCTNCHKYYKLSNSIFVKMKDNGNIQ